MSGLLQVPITSAYEAECAESGGADRLLLASLDDLTPPLDLVTKVRAASTVHLRVVLRTRIGFITDGAEMTKLKGMVSACRDAGVDGFVFGFLNALSGIDRAACIELAGDDLWGWTFDRAIDAALNQDLAWQDLTGLPRLDSVMSAGSAREVEQGLDRLIDRATHFPVIATGNLTPEQIPWLARGGVTRFQIERTPAADR
ncbi:MAG: copper homeostasis protein CutC, partial [Propionibacteriaceae bacterium]|nr:copper homeostasis protein CutC [Propionibacteriaceae bacterium]